MILMASHINNMILMVWRIQTRFSGMIHIKHDFNGYGITYKNMILMVWYMQTRFDGMMHKKRDLNGITHKKPNFNGMIHTNMSSLMAWCIQTHDLNGMTHWMKFATEFLFYRWCSNPKKYSKRLMNFRAWNNMWTIAYFDHKCWYPNLK